MGISLTYDEKVAVLDLGGDENRFSPSFLDEFDAHLDVSSEPGQCWPWHMTFG